MQKTCSKQTTKKYRSRPSPPFPANVIGCRNKTKKGNNGKMFVSRSDSRGIFRWIQKSKRK